MAQTPSKEQLTALDLKQIQTDTVKTFSALEKQAWGGLATALSWLFPSLEKIYNKLKPKSPH